MGYLLTLFSNGPKMLTTMELRGWYKGALCIISATTKKLKLCQDEGYKTPQTVNHRQRFKSLARLYCASQRRVDVSFWFNLRSAPAWTWLSTQQRVPLFSSWRTSLALRVESKHPLPVSILFWYPCHQAELDLSLCGMLLSPSSQGHSLPSGSPSILYCSYFCFFVCFSH